MSIYRREFVTVSGRGVTDRWLIGLAIPAKTVSHPFRSTIPLGATKFLKLAHETINPAVTAEDVREMLIQHILTEEIFSKVFDEDDFHRNNNVARRTACGR
jgi:hypothetical protein